MITIMVQSTADDPGQAGAVLREIVQKIADILGHQVKDSAPANAHSLRFRWPPRGLRMEALATAGGRGFWRRYVAVLTSSLIQWWCERFQRRAGPYDAVAYRDELRANTDFQKYDGILRMVLDVSEPQAALIEQRLQQEHDEGRIVYGVHQADTALMTCLVFSLDQGEHVHFVDGSNGGFAKASQSF